MQFLNSYATLWLPNALLQSIFTLKFEKHLKIVDGVVPPSQPHLSHRSATASDPIPFAPRPPDASPAHSSWPASIPPADQRERSESRRHDGRVEENHIDWKNKDLKKKKNYICYM